MNLPNRLTILRIILIPFFLFFFFATGVPHNFLWAFLIFVVAAITDTLDGQIARRKGIVTDFGKLMDPLADKLLVMCAMICILAGDYRMVLGELGVSDYVVKTISTLALIIVVSRDLVVNSIRLVAAGEGIIIAADKWGKMKTVVQMIWISLVLLDYAVPMSAKQRFMMPLHVVEDILLVLMLVLTVMSGFNYVWQNRKLFSKK